MHPNRSIYDQAFHEAVFQISKNTPSELSRFVQAIAQENERLNNEMIETFFHTYHNDHDVDIFIKNFLRDRQKTIRLRFFDLYQIEKQKKINYCFFFQIHFLNKNGFRY
jgi:hypothetical protein